MQGKSEGDTRIVTLHNNDGPLGYACVVLVVHLGGSMAASLRSASAKFVKINLTPNTLVLSLGSMSKNTKRKYTVYMVQVQTRKGDWFDSNQNYQIQSMTDAKELIRKPYWSKDTKLRIVRRVVTPGADKVVYPKQTTKRV